jgi:hypothetical protein
VVGPHVVTVVKFVCHSTPAEPEAEIHIAQKVAGEQAGQALGIFQDRRTNTVETNVAKQRLSGIMHAALTVVRPN